ncbi:ABC transporter ATP-binding protein [Ornithinimicrobium cavernae]|uniref:ABC transporter ATP-binding protein n=1 Tax=Ornithinimicrobium cavernae TaxID=2666047 RepID=UPI000D687899|nr:ABC transporter ATP-binding protein [Ornithinimicrobium cavernae]
MAAAELSPDNGTGADRTGQDPTPAVGADQDRVPAVILSHVHVTYRVFGAGRGKTVPEESRLARLLNRGANQVGVREVHAVKDVSFVAYQGESVGLIGRNGSGKSTLLRALAGLIPPDQGEIYLNGKAALLGVNAVLMRQLSGARNVMIGGQALGLSTHEVREKFDEIVDFSGIGEFINLPMSSYSSGMGSRLRFAISTAAVPDILVVDEALGTGDAEFRKKANDRINKIRESAGTVFMVSHNNATIKRMCTRALWLEQGHVIMDGPSGEVVDAYTRWVEQQQAARAKAQQAKRAQPRATEDPDEPGGDGQDEAGAQGGGR